MKKLIDMGSVSALGLAALVLRWQLYRTAVDEKGLLVRMHPLSLVLMALTAAVLLMIYVAVRKQEEYASFEECVPHGILTALGHGLLAVSILSTVLSGNPRAMGYLATAWKWLGFAAPLCLVLAGADRLLGKKSFFLLHVVPCLFL